MVHLVKGYLSLCLCITDIDRKPTRQARRGGLGFVLGFKDIKAIVVPNPLKSKLTYKNKTEFIKNAEELIDIIKNLK